MLMSGITDHRAKLHGVRCAADNKYTFDIGKHGDIAGNIIVTPATEAGMRVVLDVAGTPVWTYSSSSQFDTRDPQYVAYWGAHQMRHCILR